jgi:hypothetical protein
MMPKTTGWTEETRNQFHPGDLITVMRLDYPIYSPHRSLGLTELVYHYLGRGREACQTIVSDEGQITGFHINILPLAVKIQPTLCWQFPELFHYAKSLGTMKELAKSPEKIRELHNEIESKFGKAVTVTPPGVVLDKTSAALQRYALQARPGQEDCVIMQSDEYVIKATSKL